MVSLWKIAMIGLVVLATVAAMGSTECEAAPNPLPSVAVNLLLDNATLTPAPFSVTLVEFYGHATASKYCGIERLTVYLTAEQSEGWEMVIEPSVIPFIIATTERFTVRVIAPPGVPPGPRQLTVQGTLIVPGLAPIRCNDTINIDVEGYEHICIESVEPCVHIAGGDEPRCEVLVINQGTRDAKCFLEAKSEDGTAVHRGGTVTVTVSPGERVPLDLTLDLDRMAEGWSGPVEVTVVSFEEGVKWNDSFRRSLDTDSVVIMVWSQRRGFIDAVDGRGNILPLVAVFEVGMVVMALYLMGRGDQRAT